MSADLALARATEPEPAPVVYFFSGRSRVAELAFEHAKGAYPTVTWRRLVLRTPDEQRSFESESHAPGVVISFLNGYILTAPILAAVGGNAFNIHPAPPEFPGRDPWHFAYYDQFPRAGATLHRMTARVDEGEILDVVESEFDPSGTVVEYRELCHRLALDLFLANLGPLLAGTVEARCDRRWRVEAKRSRRDFTRMCEIDPTMAPDEVERRLRAFHTSEHDNVYTVIHGHKFFYRSSR